MYILIYRSFFENLNLMRKGIEVICISYGTIYKMDYIELVVLSAIPIYSNVLVRGY